MKTKIFCLSALFISSSLYCQSTIVFGVNTNIYVGTGANISAGTITVNGTFSGVGTFNNGPLPVELVSFSANVVKDNVELTWKTATELNNFGFEIERSIRNEDPPKAEGIRNWDKIGFIKGSGNSNSPKEYSFTDRAVATGNYFYRLKQIDHDGTFKFSGIVEVSINQIPNTYSLNQNFPNPFNPSTTIQYDIPKNSLVKISVYDVLGEEIKLLVNEEINPGHHEIVFDGRQLVSGIYYYTISAGGFNQSRKMILMK